MFKTGFELDLSLLPNKLGSFWGLKLWSTGRSLPDSYVLYKVINRIINSPDVISCFSAKVPVRYFRSFALLEVPMCHSLYARNSTLCRVSQIVNELTTLNLTT